jgi:hypothetical protein
VTTHAIAILKGAVEGDPLRHLASLLGWHGHLALLLQAGLPDRAGGPAVLTRSMSSGAAASR